MIRPPDRSTRPRRLGATIALLGALALGLAGCTDEVETEYGRARGRSINGTNAFAELLARRGHTIRPTGRYTEALGAWAKAIVRFAPGGGPPDRAEALWLREWLDADPGRRLIYVVRDGDTDLEFWTRMRAALPANARESDRSKVESKIAAARVPDPTPTPTPKAMLKPAPPRRSVAPEELEWFVTEPADPQRAHAPRIAGALTGPWAEGVDAKAAALPIREVIRTGEDDPVLLAADGAALVATLDFRGETAEGGDVLVVANAGFLLNAALLNQARRPLAARAADWLGDVPQHVAFVEGAYALTEVDDSRVSPFHLLAVSPFNWVTAHLGAFGILLCLALAASIGRPRPEPPDATERPSAHPAALGALLARTRQVGVAEDLLATYRRWRHPGGAAPPSPPPPPPPGPTTPTTRRVPRA